MEFVPYYEQVFNDCYSNPSAMMIDAFRFGYLGIEPTTYTDPLHLSIQNSYEKGRSRLFNDEEFLLAHFKKDNGIYNWMDAGSVLDGGNPYQTINKAIDIGICINEYKSGSIFYRLIQDSSHAQFKVLPSGPFAMGEFYRLYADYHTLTYDRIQEQIDEYTRLPSDRFSQNFIQLPQGIDYEIYKKQYEDSLGVVPTEDLEWIKEEYLEEQMSSLERAQDYVDRTVEWTKEGMLYTELTQDDQRDFEKFLRFSFLNSTEFMSSLDFLHTLTEFSCEKTNPLKGFAEVTSLFADNSDIEPEHVDKKERILEAYFSPGMPKHAVPLGISYCIYKTFDKNYKLCGHHSALVMGASDEDGELQYFVRNGDDEQWISKSDLLPNIYGMTGIFFDNNKLTNMSLSDSPFKSEFDSQLEFNEFKIQVLQHQTDVLKAANH